jgi:hypothetical protein
MATVTIPMVVHGEVMVVTVMMAIMMSGMRKTVTEKSMVKEPWLKEPWSKDPWPKNPWLKEPWPWPPPRAIASLCANAMNKKNVEAVASDLVETIGLDPRQRSGALSALARAIATATAIKPPA